MKNTQKYLETLIKKSINETLETKAIKLMDKIKEMEMEEGFDSPEIKFDRGGKDYDKYEFSRKVRPYEFMKDLEMDSLTPDEFEYQMDTKDIDLDDELYGDDEDLDPFIDGDDDDIEPINEGEMCEQCGGGLSEGECMECGYRQMEEETYDLNPENEFDYVEEEEEFDLSDFEIEDDSEVSMKDKKYGIGSDVDDDDVVRGYCSQESPKYNIDACKAVKGAINERLYGKQTKLDKNKNGKIDSDDFKLLRKNVNKKRKDKAEVEEGNAFTAKLAKTKKGGEFELNGKKFKDTSNYDMKNESIEYHIKDNQGDIIKLTENEIVDLIESLVNEQKTPGFKTIGKPRGLTTYEKAHKGSGDENKEYLKSVTKKMKDYLKDGSKGTYEMNPKMFPQGNGELAKMDKKAFKMTDDLEDFNYEIAGQNFPTPDAIDYNEEWMEKLFKGDSMTGNAPGGNALESKTNDRFNKMRKKNTLKKLKDQSYRRAPQPVFKEKSGNDIGKGLNIKLESLEPKKTNQLNEEFDRIKQLLGYDRKTQ
jgi:hypothetical protein